MPDNRPFHENESHLHSVLGKMVEGMRTLVEGQGDARNRVFGAGRVLITVDPSDVPEPIADELVEINEWLTRFPAERPGETSLEATFRRTRNSTASRMAGRIFRLYQAVRKMYAEQSEENR